MIAPSMQYSSGLCVARIFVIIRLPLSTFWRRLYFYCYWPLIDCQCPFSFFMSLSYMICIALHCIAPSISPWSAALCRHSHRIIYAQRSVASDAVLLFVIDLNLNPNLNLAMFHLRGDQWAVSGNPWWKMKTKSDFESESTRRILDRSHWALCDPELCGIELVIDSATTTTTTARVRWPEPSKRRENRREERHQESNWRPKLPENQHHRPEAWRMWGDSVQEPSHWEKSDDIRNRQNCWWESCHFRDWSERLRAISRMIWDFKQLQLLHCKKQPKRTWYRYLRIRIWQQFMQNEWQ